VRFSLRQLEVFRALAAAGSVVRAADELGCTQSALSMSLRELQQALGVALVQRSGRRLVLTAAGERFLPRADELLLRVDDLRRDTASAAGAVGVGRLAVGASRTIGTALMPQLVVGFRRELAIERIELTIGNTEEVLARVANYELDAAFVEGESLDPRLQGERWMKDELVVFVRPSHPLLAGGRRARAALSPAELSRWPWALRERHSGTREVVLRAAAELGRIEVGIEATDNEVLKRLVALDDWVGCLSRRAVESDLAGGTLVELPLASRRMRAALTRDFLLVHNPERYPSATASRFIEFARRWARSESGGRT
jgi:DNA-binding transcriptional LysR family regulator